MPTPRSRARNWELVWEIAKTDFRLRYHGSVLGILWMVVKPLCLFLILLVVFSRSLGSATPHYPLSLLVGVLFWGYFAEGTMLGMQSLLSKGYLLTKAAVTPWALVAAATLQALFVYLVNLLVLTIFLLSFRLVPHGRGMILFLGESVLLTALIVSVSLLASPFFVRFRDLRQLWEVFLTFGFYLTPIIYPATILPEKAQMLLRLNPLAVILENARFALLEQPLPSWARLTSALVVIPILLVIGIMIFRRSAATVAEHI